MIRPGGAGRVRRRCPTVRGAGGACGAPRGGEWRQVPAVRRQAARSVFVQYLVGPSAPPATDRKEAFAP